MDGRGYG